jgi:hypothetical protein
MTHGPDPHHDAVLRAAEQHAALLREVEQQDDDTPLVARAQTLIDVVRRLGERVPDMQDRDYLESLLAFWGGWVYQHTRVYPPITLYPLAQPADIRTASALSAQVADSMPVFGVAQPFVMASIVQPAHGTRVRATTALHLAGVYANLPDGSRLFALMAHNRARQQGEMLPLNDGLLPDARTGTWQIDLPGVPQGEARFGVAIALTAASIERLRAAYLEGHGVQQPPEGALLLMPLCVVLAD